MKTLAGDGITDDTEALQALIDAAVAAGETLVRLPPGMYLVNGPKLDLRGLSVSGCLDVRKSDGMAV